MDLGEIGHQDWRQIELAQDCVWWWTFVLAVLNFFYSGTGELVKLVRSIVGK